MDVERIILVVVLGLAVHAPSLVFADEEITSGFQEPIIGFFEWINEIFTESIETSGFEEDTKENLQNTLDSGTEAGAQGTILWFKVHEFLVNAIFAGTDEADLPVSKDIIVIIAIVAVLAGIILMVRHMWKENTKIALIVILVLVGLGVSGVFISF